MSLQRLAILFVFVNLVGCSTMPTPETIIITNNEKDIYIKNIEAEVSEANSALTAILPSIPAGASKEIIKGQITRLSAIAKASVERVEAFKKMVDTNDTKSIKKDQEEALKFEFEANDLRAIIEEKDGAIAIAQAIADKANEESQRAIKDKVLWMLSCIGAGIALAGLLVVAFTPWKIRGFVLIAGGSIATASAWILDTKWFELAVCVILFVIVIDIVFTIIKLTVSKFRPLSPAPDVLIEGLKPHMTSTLDSSVSESKRG